MFSAADQKLIELLAAHAAIAIENARLHERSRELSIVEERNRLARELHDSRHAAAVRRRAGRRVGARRCWSATAATAAVELRAGERARPRRDGGAARGRLRAAARVAGGRGAGDRAAQARRGAAAGVRAGRSSCASCDVPRLRARAGDAGAADRAGGARQRAAPLRRPSGSRSSSAAPTAARPDGHRRRLRLRSRRPRGARAAARADVDGGARDRARRDAARSPRRSARARPCGWRCPT